MPKETFLNLPEEKRKKIEEAAIEEFEQYNFDSASINRIVENSQISKGSFYQYFENKKDLYKYIINHIIEQKMNYLSPVMMNPDEHDFFTIIKEMYASALNFAKENPRLVTIGNRLMSDRTHALYKEIIKDNMSISYNVFETLIEKAIIRGEIRNDIDIKLMSYIISSLNVLIVEYYQENIEKELDNKIMPTLDEFLRFVQIGIGKKS